MYTVYTNISSHKSGIKSLLKAFIFKIHYMALSNKQALRTQVISNYSMYYIPCVPFWFTAVYMDTKNAFSNIPRNITTAIQNYK